MDRATASTLSRAPARRAAARRVHSASFPDQVVRAIYDGILAHRYAVGQRLVEADLTQELGVSRGTIREALKQLAAVGVVTLAPHRGAFVRFLTRRNAQDLLLVLEVLCGLAVRLASERIDANGNRRRFETAMKGILSFENRLGNSSFLEERARFYQTILEIADNPELVRAMPLPQIHLFRVQFHGVVPTGDLAKSIKEYREISVAILAADAAAAESRMCRHIRKTGERLLKLPDSAFAREEP